MGLTAEEPNKLYLAANSDFESREFIFINEWMIIKFVLIINKNSINTGTNQNAARYRVTIGNKDCQNPLII